MNKRKVLLAALLICFSISWQTVNAQGHVVNEDLNGEYTGRQDTYGGVLEVNGNGSNNIIKSTIKNNTATSSGGAVYNSGTLSIEGSSFEENKAERSGGKGDGGAIYNNGTLTVEGSSFVNNNAGKGEIWQEEGQGGAIYNSSNATITNSTFTGNHARYGGAIYNAANANITVGGTFTNNTAQNGGAIKNDQGTVTIGQGSTFENNSTTRYDGGAINNYDGTINIEDNVTFKNNTAFQTEEAQKGGAISSEGEGNSKIEIGKNVTFEGNKAKSGGGIGLYKHNDVTIGDNATFKNNQAGREGGAIDVYTIETDPKPSSFTIGDNAVFEGNQAGFVNEEGYTPDVVFGGAIAVSEQINNDEKNSSFTIGDNAVFRNNKAIYEGVSGYGGALYNAAYKTTVGKNALFDGNISNYGGAVYNQANLEIGQNALFKGNTATLGGAIYNTKNLNLGANASFRGNSASSLGGAIYNSSSIENSIQKAEFKNNQASIGGAIYNNKGTLSITDSVFTGNRAKSETSSNDGGAIYNKGTVTVTNSIFENNEANFIGGAVINTNSLTVENSGFTSNKAVYGGAIAASKNDTATKVTKTTFKSNYAVENDGSGGQGGAIYSDDYFSNSTLDIEDSLFDSNTAATQGGAIYSGDVTNIKNSVFLNNRVEGKNITRDSAVNNNGGGAIFIADNSKTTVEKSDFINNYSSNAGGAILAQSNSEDNNLTVTGSSFNGNRAEQNGGGLATHRAVTVTDTSFVNNKAGDKGGAIWANDDVTVNANEKDVVFAGNSAKDGADIYMDKTSAKIGTLTLKANQDKNITLADGISGAEKYNVNLDGQGTVTFNGEIKNADMKVTSGTLHLAQGSSIGDGTTVNVTGATLDSQDGKINDYSGKVNIGDNSKLKFDLSSANKITDKFSKAAEFSEGKVAVEDFNFIPDTIVSSGNMTSDEIKESLGFGEEVNLELPEKSFSTLTPLRYVNVQSGKDGVSYTPTGNSYRDFNPAVMAAPVAAQLGGYLTQLDSYDEAFRNMDMYMVMPKSVRQSMKYQNKFASADNDMVAGYDKSKNQYDNTALWARPYVTFENVRLKHGPRVSNVAWGTYFGGDSEMFELGNGWEGMWGVYAGYNGSHQAYDGVGIYQNGGTLGVTGVLYKNNFFTGLTANVGANAAETSTNYGEDSFAKQDIISNLQTASLSYSQAG